MKNAINKDKDGDVIVADKNSPPEAVCHTCGGVVLLRSRSIMNSKKRSYFWRHVRNSNLNCTARRRPVY